MRVINKQDKKEHKQFRALRKSNKHRWQAIAKTSKD